MPERDPKKKKTKASPDVLSWRQKKELADMEDEAVGRDVEELVSWASMVEAMDDKQLQEYVLNQPETKQATRSGKGKKVRRTGKSRSSSSSASQGLMAAIWKFHKEDEEEASITIQI